MLCGNDEHLKIQKKVKVSGSVYLAHLLASPWPSPFKKKHQRIERIKIPHPIFKLCWFVWIEWGIPFGPSSAARTRGLLLPNLSGTLFPLVYSGFRCFLICFTYSLTLISPLFPSVPEPSVVIYVVKNASHPISGEDSPVPDGKRFAFQIVCIVTLRRVLCKWFLRRQQLKG